MNYSTNRLSSDLRVTYNFLIIFIIRFPSGMHATMKEAIIADDGEVS